MNFIYLCASLVTYCNEDNSPMTSLYGNQSLKDIISIYYEEAKILATYASAWKLNRCCQCAWICESELIFIKSILNSEDQSGLTMIYPNNPLLHPRKLCKGTYIADLTSISKRIGAFSRNARSRTNTFTRYNGASLIGLGSSKNNLY